MSVALLFPLRPFTSPMAGWHVALFWLPLELVHRWPQASMFQPGVGDEMLTASGR